ncbi:universal stress protein [Geofilum sp. OHC36d9]|uniref:universal stress protein n=1 Tax=Geofilum sp. OHC36d9 TaxID=3458413 RepID=UPI0040342FFF
MKRIVLLTDFSETARNAAVYGIQMFQEKKAEFYLFHAFDVEFSGSPYIMQVKDEMAEESQKGLKKELSILHRQFPNVRIHLISRYGSLIEVLRMEMSEAGLMPDMVILGCRGESALENFLLGSNAFDVIRHINMPLIVVPRTCSYRKPKKLVFATDLKTIDDNIALPLFELVRYLNAELMFVNVLEDEYINRLEAEETIAGYFPDVKLSFHFIDDSDICKGICSFAGDNGADMVVMIRYNYSFFERVFHPSITKKMVLQPEFPMIILHGLPKN